MTRSLLIAASPGELRAAIVERSRLLDFRLVRTVALGHVGDVHLGRVVRLLPALRAALIDIGLERPAFLSAEEGAPRRDLATLHEGAAVLVQIKRESRADKAAAVTMRVRLAGRFALWTPARPGIAAEAIDAAVRERLAPALAAALAPHDGVRLLAAAAATTPQALAAEIATLRARWTAIGERRRTAEPPNALEARAPLPALLTDFADATLGAIEIDDSAVFVEVRAWLAREQPSLAPLLAPSSRGLPIFRAHGVAEAVESLFDFQVPLGGGASLSIEPVAAATLIDVDSGSLAEERQIGEDALLAVDLEAAAEIARQIRLRDLAGAIVIDFIPLRRAQSRARLSEAFREALGIAAPDSQILGWTRLGHLELVRPRRRTPLHDLVFERTPRGGLAKTALTVALEALAAVAQQAAGRAVTLHLHPSVIAALENDAAPARQALEARLGRALALVPEPGWSRDHFDIGSG